MSAAMTSPETLPEIPTDRTDATNGSAGVVRILLGRTASDHLSAVGEQCFVVVGRASYPDDPTRWVIHLVPSTIKDADNAVRVARGLATARAVKGTQRQTSAQRGGSQPEALPHRGAVEKVSASQPNTDLHPQFPCATK